jgi:hypothetical protein
VLQVSKLKIVDTIEGRVIAISRGGKVYIGRKYKLYSYEIDTKKLSLVTRVPCSPLRRLIQPNRLLCRLFRHEIRGFAVFADGSRAVAVRQGLYYGTPGQTVLQRASVLSSQPFMAPASLTQDSHGRILWGEYGTNKNRLSVKLFCSEDKGKNYEVVFEFKAGEIRHIHNIIEDLYDNCYLVFAGDHNKEPGIARLTRDFKNLEWLVKGEQKYRAVGAFVFKDKIIYGSDTEIDLNGIYSLDKHTAKVEKLCDIPGSALSYGFFGKWYAVSTWVEYFKKCRTENATLWISRDAVNWKQVLEIPKDMWSKKYFQYGGIIFPAGRWDRNEIVFSGQAVKEFDHKVCVAEIIED